MLFQIFSVNSEQPVVQMHRTNLQKREWCRSGRSWEQSVFHLQRWWFCMTTHCNVELLQWTSCGNPVLWHSMPAICKHIVKCSVTWRTKWRWKIQKHSVWRSSKYSTLRPHNGVLWVVGKVPSGKALSFESVASQCAPLYASTTARTFAKFLPSWFI